MTKEEIINSIHIDKANLEYIASTGKINGTLLSELNRCLDKYAQSIVLGKLPSDEELKHVGTTASDDTGDARVFMDGVSYGLNYMRIEATQRIITCEEVEKPFRELLEEIADSETTLIPDELYERIKELMKP